MLRLRLAFSSSVRFNIFGFAILFQKRTSDAKKAYLAFVIGPVHMTINLE